MGTVAPIVMSAIVFAGSSQFAATAVLAAGGGPLAAVAAGILLNARYVPMGVALAPSLEGGALRRAARRPGDDRRLVGDGEPRRRPLRPAFMLGATLPSYPAGSAVRRSASSPEI